MLKDLLKDADHRMQGALKNLTDDLAAIRTGRANPALVERLNVVYYDMPTPLMQLASISVPEPRSLMIKPFDGSTLKDIEKARTELRTTVLTASSKARDVLTPEQKAELKTMSVRQPAGGDKQLMMKKMRHEMMRENMP